MVKTALALILTLLFAVAPTHAERYLWTLSASTTDPFENTAAPTPPLFELHLWLACSTEGMAAAEFMVEASAGLQVLAWTPCCGFLFTGPTECLLLATGGCPSGPQRAGWFLVFDPVGVGGRVCIVDCPTSGTNVTVDCDPQQPELHPNAWIGFASDGMPPCSSGTCGPVAVEAKSWGRIKGIYH